MIDLRKFTRYKVQRDICHVLEHGMRSKTVDLALLVIPGARGHIYPDGDDLVVATEGRGHLVRKLRAVPGLVVIQDGDDGINARFPPEHIDVVAKIIEARRKRVMTEDQVAKLIEAGAATRFNPGVNVTNSQAPDARTGLGQPERRSA